MFTYRISDGEFCLDSDFEGTGYSGAGLTLADGRNNLTMVNVEGKGPIPPGKYRIMPPRNSKTLGPVVFDLVPLPGTNTFDRSLFRIHGNNKDNNASHGCIILGPKIRDAIAKIFTTPPPANDDYNIIEVLAA